VVRDDAEQGGYAEVTVDIGDTVTRIAMAGEIDMNTQARLDAALAQVDARPLRPVLVDLGDLVFLGSTGVDFLAKLHRRTQSGGHAVTLLNAPDIVVRVLELNGLTRHFPRVANPPPQECIDTA
jgi:anti-sigma B factor antagonist